MVDDTIISFKSLKSYIIFVNNVSFRKLSTIYDNLIKLLIIVDNYLD